MHLSLVIGLDETRRRPDEVAAEFRRKAEYLSGLGYDGVELALVLPERVPAGKLAEACESLGVKVPAVGTGSTYLRCGYHFGTSDRHLREKALERTAAYAQFASRFDALVIVGLLRGRYRLPDTSEQALERVVECLERCGELGDEHGVDFVLEPINRFEVDCLHTVAETAEVVHRVNHPRVKLMLDNFHLNLEEEPGFVNDELPRYCADLAHVHVADTNRRAPGTGTFDYGTFVRVLRENLYAGFLSVETIHKPSFEAVAEVSAKTLLPLFGRPGG
ncbi:MAG: sugar phosphate isomerase/epimerase [Promethearchaeota archaeon]